MSHDAPKHNIMRNEKPSQGGTGTLDTCKAYNLRLRQAGGFTLLRVQPPPTWSSPDSFTDSQHLFHTLPHKTLPRFRFLDSSLPNFSNLQLLENSSSTLSIAYSHHHNDNFQTTIMLHQALRRLRAKFFGRNTHTTVIIIAGPSPAAPPPTRNPSHVVRTKAQRNAPPKDLSQKLHELSEAQRSQRDPDLEIGVVLKRETHVVDREKPDVVASGDEKNDVAGVAGEILPEYEQKGYYDVDHVRFCKLHQTHQSEYECMLADAVAYLASLRD